MILGIFVDDCNAVQRKLKSANPVLTNVTWRSGKQKEQLDISKLSVEERAELKAIVDAEAKNGNKHYATVQRKWNEWAELLSDKSGGAQVKKLDLIPAAVKAFFSDLDHKWVFYQHDDGSINPFFVRDVVHHKAKMQYGEYIPAHTIMTVVAYKNGETIARNVTWHMAHLGRTVQQLLSLAGFMPETQEAVNKFKTTYKEYLALQDQQGRQMVAYGEGYVQKSYYSTGLTSMVREGIPTKVVIDHDSGEAVESRSSRSSSSDMFIRDTFWGEIPNRSGMSTMDSQEIADQFAEMGEANRVDLPVHPYLNVFDLDKHQWVNIHLQNLSAYEWDKELINKLIIKDEDKELISILMDQTSSRVEDIVKGKMSGVVVLATGTPGIGKTLTAEVFSETIEKPLYTVQCSQLGLNVNEIEKNLTEILNRASRWGAILLIDEADVYIRRRGDDITQNAIVGVFLRLIEYYRGVLFMTSNRGDEIDDAIISRATAWVKYELPDPELLGKIWSVLGKQYGTELKSADVKTLIAKLPGISGRTVRNLLKLARMLKGADEQITVEDIIRCGKYQQLEGGK